MGGFLRGASFMRVEPTWMGLVPPEEEAQVLVGALLFAT